MTLPAFFADAECKGLETRWFFPWNPAGEMRPSPLARQACSRCGVRGECLTFSLRHPIQEGFWGGMTLEERLAERRRRHIQKRTDSRRAARKAAAGQEEAA